MYVYIYIYIYIMYTYNRPAAGQIDDTFRSGGFELLGDIVLGKPVESLRSMSRREGKLHPNTCRAY